MSIDARELLASAKAEAQEVKDTASSIAVGLIAKAREDAVAIVEAAKREIGRAHV